MQLKCIVDVVSLNGIGIFKRNSILETTNKAIIRFVIMQKWFAEYQKNTEINNNCGVGKTTQTVLDEIVIPAPITIRRKGL